MKISGCDVPDWMLRLKTMKTKDKQRYRNSAPRRHSISTVNHYDAKRRAKRQNMIKQSSAEGHRRKQVNTSHSFIIISVFFFITVVSLPVLMLTRLVITIVLLALFQNRKRKYEQKQKANKKSDDDDGWTLVTGQP